MANIDASTLQLKAVKNWIDALASVDISKVVPLISKDFKYRSFPQVIELPEIHDQAKEEHIQWLEGVMASITKVEFIVHEVIEAPGKVVIHLTVPITLIDGTTYDYDSLSIVSLVEEDGDIKILECRDFSDPYKRGVYYAGVAKVAGVSAS